MDCFELIIKLSINFSIFPNTRRDIKRWMLDKILGGGVYIALSLYIKLSPFIFRGVGFSRTLYF